MSLIKNSSLSTLSVCSDMYDDSNDDDRDLPKDIVYKNNYKTLKSSHAVIRYRLYIDPFLLFAVNFVMLSEKYLRSKSWGVTQTG